MNCLPELAAQPRGSRRLPRSPAAKPQEQACAASRCAASAGGQLCAGFVCGKAGEKAIIGKEHSMEWTEQQERAINFRGGSAIVSAAAGSGKTAVLVERIIRIVRDEENPTNADEIVVATFTEKAAGELKTRLNNALSEAIEADPDNEYLKAQLLRLEDASISTISAFCLDILRRNSAALGISPDFSVLDEAEGKLLFVKSIDEVLEQFFAEATDEEKKLIYDWYGGENDSRLCELVKMLYEFSKNLPYSKKAFSECLKAYENPSEISCRLLNGFISTQIEPYRALIKETIMNLAQSFDEKEQEFAAAWTEFSDPFFQIVNFVEAREEMTYILKQKLPTVPRKTKTFDNTILKECAEQLKEYWQKSTSAAGLVSRMNDDYIECAPVLKILLRLTEELDREFSQRKRMKNAVDFSDIELMTLELLRDEGTAEQLRKNIAMIIVDEFQDSNEIQYEIFRRLSRNEENMFFVGDAKQSIYRFRGADPRVFTRLLDDEKYEKILLNRNFRSAAPVIESVNAIFEGNMTRELGGINYGSEHKLIQGADYETDEQNQTELIQLYGSDAEDSRRREAAYIADRIRDMVESGFPVTEKGVKRPCGYGDFAILMGKYSANAYIYKNALASAGIPFEAKDESGYTDFSEVKFMMSLLRVIDNPYRDLDLAAVLTLPPYSFTAQELAETKLGGGETKFGSMYSGLCKYAELDKKAKAFLDELEELREFAREQSAEELVRKIYDESPFVEAMRAMPDGEKRDANLKLMIGYARRFTESAGWSLYDFLNYMSRAEREQVRLSQAKSAETSAQSVKLMTIHGSKGLEFPICIVANLSSAHRSRDNPYMALESNLGIGMKIIDREKKLIINTFGMQAISQSNYEQELSEEMRLLYVAATRAKEKLIFTAPIPQKQSSIDVHLKWVLNSRAVSGGIIHTEKILYYTPKKRIERSAAEREAAPLKPFEPYAYLHCSQIPAKVTATQVGVKSVDDFSEFVDKVDRFLRSPTFIKEDSPRKLTGKKKGDAYHKAMELLDFSGTAAQLDDFFSCGKLTEAERQCISTEEMTAFLESGLCGRLCASSEVHREYPIFCEYDPGGLPEGDEKPFIQGIADLWFVEDGKIVLVDYKTNSNTTPEKLLEEYEGQLGVYKYALEQMTGLSVKECLLYSFSLKAAVPVSC